MYKELEYTTPIYVYLFIYLSIYLSRPSTVKEFLSHHYVNRPIDWS
ncbi:hypothetical protein DFA_01630 [Cavenderia fasciculata]|uniref:Uncharacterized protein n=1 Tax=Cavenderia fasciculata TaxID=261658 RepID=F4PTX6_CACFS|nr:uncharacterized protein DFA_01630 [Cavenderia fasciculata]EGG21744.1 hypothetical protein DFA_01630 [Cavenderia fasciculata]|eukprot:XP_004359594.1 hypothetical protein DFA_01630 [Cavenderia fasciculata]